MKIRSGLFFIFYSFSTVWAQLPAPVIQTGNANEIKVITVSRDGLLYASGGSDNIVVLWDAKSRGQIAKFRNDGDIRQDTLYGKLIVPSTNNSAVADYEFAPKSSGNEISAIAINASNDYIAIGNKQGEIFCRNIITGESTSIISFPKSTLTIPIRKLFYSDNGRYLIVQDRSFRIYDLRKTMWVYDDPQIVAFDFSSEEQLMYVVKKKRGKLIVQRAKIPEVELSSFVFENADTILTNVLNRKKKLIKGFDPAKLQFVVQNSEKMAFLYNSALRWKNGKRYFLRAPNEHIFRASFGSVSFVGENEIAICAGNLFTWNTINGREVKHHLDDFTGADILVNDARAHIMLTAIGTLIQAVNLRTGRTEVFGEGNYSVKQMQMGSDGTLYLNNGVGISTFSSETFPPVSSYVSGSHRYYRTIDKKQIILTRKNKTLILNENGDLLKKRATDNRIMVMEPMLLFIRTMFLLGGNYSVFISNPWGTSIVSNSLYSENNNVLLFTTQKIPYGGQRIEVLNLLTLKKTKGVRCYGKGISCLAFSKGETFLASSGTSHILGDKKTINIHAMKGIGSKSNNPILTIRDSTFNTVKNMAFSNTGILAAATNSTIINFDKKRSKTTLINAYEKRSIRFFNTGTGELIGTLEGSSGPMVFIQGGKTLIFAGQNNLKVFSMDSFKVIRSWKAHSDLITSLCFDSLRNQLISSSLDGSLRFWNWERGELIATLYQKKMEYILLTPDGYYVSTKLGTKAVGYGMGNRFVSFEQFDIHYNRPDIVLKRLGWVTTDVQDIMKRAYEKRIRHFNIDTTQSVEYYANLPELSLRNKSDIPLETSVRNFKVIFDLWPKNDTIQRIKVELNTIPIFGSKGKKVSIIKDKVDSLMIPLDPGENEIKLYAINNKGNKSLLEMVKISYHPSKKDKAVKAKTWTVHIGISNFKDSSMNLRYAGKDAVDLYQYYHSLNNTYSIILKDEQVNRENLLAIRDTLMKSSIDDHVILTYSGHGLLSESKDYFLSTYSVDFNNPSRGGISYEDLLRILDSIPARKKMIFLDACHSGDLDKPEINTVASDSIIEGVKGSRLVNNTDSKNGRSPSAFSLMQQLFVNMDPGNGTTVCAASAGSESALEGNKWDNGVFTYCLLQGIRDKKADSDKNGHIDISEIKKFILEKVPEYTNGRQTPGFRIENLRDNWWLN